MIRVISTTFVAVALAIFKPFGLDAWQWQAYVHLVAIWALGLVVCMITGSVMKNIIRMPRAYDKGVGYIIQRNLWFQLINTPLIALTICLYRHFMLSDRVEGNRLSLANFLETLLIIAFCSFAIGLYWRFKFRSKYLAAELEETRLLNEQLKKMQQPASVPIEEGSATPQALDSISNHQDSDATPLSLRKGGNEIITLTGTTNETVTLQIADLLYIEAVGNYVKVYQIRDEQVRNDMLRSTSKQIEDELAEFSMIIRCHRAFIVNLQQVERIISKSGSMQLLIKHSHDYIPVSRSNMSKVKDIIKPL
jgi:DNA-binding LytR/AlgR family response regulator